MNLIPWLLMCAVPGRGEPAPPGAPAPIGAEVARPLAPGAPARGELGTEPDHYTIVVPRTARSLTYVVSADHAEASVSAQVWHRGQLVDEIYGDAIRAPRTVGVRPGQRYGLALVRRSGPTPLPYQISITMGSETWEIEPNHVDANPLPMGMPLRGHLGDDDRFVLKPVGGARRIAVELIVKHGAAWLAVVGRSGEAFPPRVVQARHREVFEVQDDRPLTVLVRPLLGRPDYRIRADPRDLSGHGRRAP